MRSEIAKKIISETPREVKDSVKEYGEIITSIELTEDELNAAIYEGKKKKFFHERNKDKWPADAYEGDKGSMMGKSF